MKILLGISGSVAAIKCKQLVQELQQLGFDVRVVFTHCALHFVPLDSLADADVQVYTDEDEWKSYSKRGDPVMHIEVGILGF
jgi:phosphopantothenoylcysteine decarboxylase